MVQGTQGFRQVRAAVYVIPYIMYGLYCLGVMRYARCVLEGSLSALIYPGGQGYMEILVWYELRSPNRVLSGSFLLYRLVVLAYEYFTVWIRYRTCPTPYFRMFYATRVVTLPQV